MLSSEVSSSEDDGAGQLSNLRAIALIENETRRYESSLTLITSKPNKISLSRQEKTKAKKRVKRYPSYGHIKGEYTIAPNTNTYHITRIGKSNNYYYSNLESRQYNNYKLRTRSLIRKNLQQSNYRIFQPAPGSWNRREEPAQRNSSVEGSTPRGGSSSEPVLPWTRNTERRSTYYYNTSTSSKQTNHNYFPVPQKQI